MYRPDTSDEAQKVYDELIRKLSPEERFLRGINLTVLARQMCLDGIVFNHPEMTQDQIRNEFARRVYPEIKWVSFRDKQ